MNGKVNIVFGFIYLACTAVLGPTLLVPKLGENARSFNNTAAVVEKVREGGQSGFSGADAPEAVIGPAVVSIFDHLRNTKKLPASAVHVHGNLEALLNIAAGTVLLTLAISHNFKALLSILFIIGAVFHSGMLYLGGVFGMGWAYNFTIVGAVSLISGLALTGIAAITGIKQNGRQ